MKIYPQKCILLESVSFKFITKKYKLNVLIFQMNYKYILCSQTSYYINEN